jgi:hypothetical protein
MRITTRIVWDWSGKVLEHEYQDYTGAIAHCGGGDQTDQAAEQQQATFDTGLMSMYQAQYATQQSQLSYLQNKMQPIINAGGTGYSSQQLASMRTGATDANAQQLQNAQGAMNNSIEQNSGGSKLAGVAGSTVEANAALLNASAQQQAGSQEAITTQNANLQQSNYWNAINALNGVAAQENPLGYASAATSGSNAVAGLSQANTAAEAEGNAWMGMVGSIAGGAGAALSGGASKGGLFAGCWIAASRYGWNDIRTWMVRMWLLTEAPTWFRNFYLNYGERIAKTPMRYAFYPLFEAVLRFA